MTDTRAGAAGGRALRPAGQSRGRGRAGARTRSRGGLGLFVRQVIDELRKVIWPSRRDLINYTVVVLVFVTVLTTIVALLDVAFAKGALAVFG